jgi:diacylglycerol kinase (ATP)
MDAPPPPNCAKNQPFARRLGFALHGIRTVFAHESSFRTQSIFAIGACAGALLVAPSPAWVAAIMLSAGLVLSLELVNASIEYLLDHLHPGYSPEVGAAKDAAAGAVLVASFTSLGVAGAMLWALLAGR